MKKFFFALWCAACTLLIPIHAGAALPGSKVVFVNEEEASDPDFKSAYELALSGKYEQALSALEKKASDTKHGATYGILKGLIRLESGKPREALDAFRQASLQSGRHPGLHFSYCQTYRILGKAELSERACKIAMDQHRDVPEIRYELAQILMATGQMERANLELAAALEMGSKDPRLAHDRGMNFFYLNQPDAAEKEFLHALSLNPDHLDSAYQLAYLYAKRNQIEKAEQYINHIRSSPKRNESISQSAKILQDYIDKKSTDKLPMGTVPHDYHFTRSQAMYRAGKFGPSLIEMETASRLKPDDMKTLEILVGMYGVFLRIEESEQAVKHILELAAGNQTLQAKANQELGDICILQGKLDEARKFYEQSQSLGDPDSLAKISLAEISKALKAQLLLPDHGDIYIDPADGLNRKGEIFAHYGMNERAAAIFQMVLKMNPGHLTAKLNLATVHYHSGDYPKAITLLERILLQHPRHEHILSHRVLLARAYAQQGDFDPAIKNLEIALKLNPGLKPDLEKDPDLKKLQDHESFKKLFQESH